LAVVISLTEQEGAAHAARGAVVPAGQRRVGTPLISRGGRRGIGQESYFPDGLLTTAQPVGYFKPVTGSICDSRWLGELHLVTGFRQKDEVT
jgi:hypothetical protein